MRTLAVLLLATALTVAVAAACGGGGAASRTTTLAATAAPTATAPPRHSGVPEVDVIIDALAARDLDALRPLVRFRPEPCIGPTPGSLGALFCKEGEAGGTQVNVLPVAECESAFVRESQFVDSLVGLTGAPLRVYAVYRSGDEYQLVVQQEVTRSTGILLSIAGGRVTEINFGCGEPPSAVVTSVPPEDFVLPPP